MPPAPTGSGLPPVLRGYGVPLLRHLPDAEVVHLPGVGDMPMFDDPPLIARTILEVTSRADAAAGSPA